MATGFSRPPQERSTCLARPLNQIVVGHALEESLIFVLTQLQPAATRFSFPDHELTSRKSQAVVIDDERALDAEWLTFSTTSKPDKNAIKEALKAGRQITGAQLLNRRSWRIH